MQFQSRVIGTIAVAASLALGAAGVAAQAQTSGAKPVIPDAASTLEGVPTVRVDTTKEGAKRRQLTGEEAAQSALKIKVVEGKYYWESRGNRPLTVTSSANTPTSRPSQVNTSGCGSWTKTRSSHVEHVDKAWESVTFWGELRVVLKGKE